MEGQYEGRLVYLVMVVCIALSQFYFLLRDNRGNRAYRQTKKACDANSRSGQDDGRARQIEIKSNLPNLDTELRIWYTFSFVVNMYLAIKYLVLCLLDSSLFARYRYLDCYLMGRVALNGRIVGMTKYAVFCQALFQLTWRFTMLIVKPNFDLDHLEFLLQKPSELLARQAADDKQRADWNQQCRMRRDKTIDYDPILYYKNPLVAHGHNCPIQLRPNRTYQAWRRIWRSLFIYLIGALGSLVPLIAVTLSMSPPIVITRPGFKLNYRYCIEWVTSQPNARDYEFIYAGISNDTQRVRPQALMPFDDFIELNPYQLARIVLDSFETLMVSIESVISFVFDTMSAIGLAFDMHYYCHAINVRVNRVIFSLCEDIRKASLGRDQVATTQRNHDDDNQETRDIQAMIMDYLARLASCNSYAAFHIIFILSIWFVFSAICASWLFMPNNPDGESGKLEWYIIQAASTTFIMITIGCFNAVHRESARLYRAIATLAVLTGARPGGAGKCDRWQTFLKHYTPQPLASFRTFSKSEISWLLGVKMVAWLVSALFVASGLRRTTDKHW